MAKYITRPSEDSSGSDYNTLEKDKELTKHFFYRTIVTIKRKSSREMK